MNRAIETRLRKLEAARKPDDGVFFLIWGRNEDERDQAMSNAVAIGTVSTGDTIVRALWTGNGLPASRWITKGNLTDQEDEALVEEMQRRLGMTEDVDVAEWTGWPDARVVQLSDEQLFALALGEAAGSPYPWPRTSFAAGR